MQKHFEFFLSINYVCVFACVIVDLVVGLIVLSTFFYLSFYNINYDTKYSLQHKNITILFLIFKEDNIPGLLN